jgi:chaperonin cofactor prefoldin
MTAKQLKETILNLTCHDLTNSNVRTVEIRYGKLVVDTHHKGLENELEKLRAEIKTLEKERDNLESRIEEMTP